MEQKDIERVLTLTEVQIKNSSALDARQLNKSNPGDAAK